MPSIFSAYSGRTGRTQSLNSNQVKETQKAIAKAVFDIVYDRSSLPPEMRIEHLDGRHLELSHFEALASLTRLSLDDLSLYVLGYYFNSAGGVVLHISEAKFIVGVVEALSRIKNEVTLSSDNEYQPVFDELHNTVMELNRELRSNPAKRNDFYLFLYKWCLKSNKNDDRDTIATELWDMFFSPVPLQPASQQSMSQFSAYMYFPMLHEWNEFFRQHARKSNRESDIDVTLDVWNQLLHFSEIHAYTTYDENGAWPIAMDTFVEHMKSTGKS